VGLGRRTFAPGEVLTASNVMNYLQDQAVMNFAGTAARGSAIGTALSEGMVSYLNDTDSLEVYRAIGTAAPSWQPVAFESYVNGRSGLVPITAGSATVTGAGSSVSENDLGTITFGTATSVILDGVFTSAYRNYKIVMDFEPSVGNTFINAQYRNAGATLTASTYLWGVSGIATGAASNTSAQNVTVMQMTGQTLSAASNVLTFDIITPADAATRTQYVGQFARSRDAYVIGGIYQAAATDGILLPISSGNITGKLTIYGWNQ
jgi:hypothetical protein